MAQHLLQQVIHFPSMRCITKYMRGLFPIDFHNPFTTINSVCELNYYCIKISDGTIFARKQNNREANREFHGQNRA